MNLFLATNNRGKIERYKNLLKQIDKNIRVFTPADLNIEAIDVLENGKTLEENAELKANAYLGKVDMPILANDTGFYVEGDGFVDAPKRTALGETGENSLSKEEVSEKILNFWKEVATKHGGKVDAAWIEAFVVIYPNGKTEKAESRRDIVLTNQEFGIGHVQMPMRALYYSKATNKPAILHTAEEETLEMKPVIDALTKALSMH
jgi:XTP/dITP diphosphohydrolase